MLVTVKEVLVNFGDVSSYSPSNLNSVFFTLFFPHLRLILYKEYFNFSVLWPCYQWIVSCVLVSRFIWPLVQKLLSPPLKTDVKYCSIQCMFNDVQEKAISSPCSVISVLLSKSWFGNTWNEHWCGIRNCKQPPCGAVYEHENKWGIQNCKKIYFGPRPCLLQRMNTNTSGVSKTAKSFIATHIYTPFLLQLWIATLACQGYLGCLRE